MTPSRPVRAAPPLWRQSSLAFDDLVGWREDDHEAALAAFLETCDLLEGPEWRQIRDAARAKPDPRAFFERFFRPVLVGDGPALFTGYYEPELPGALSRSARFCHPIYARPDDLPETEPWATRAEIEAGGLLEGRGLEIAWLEDPVEAFFLQVQGSGRIRLPDGGILRVSYDGRNGHPYRSIGQEMIRRGFFTPEEITATAIKDWLRRNPSECRSLLHHNASYVFFRALTNVPADKGPLGTMGRPVTPGRSIAVDPEFTPLGAPVWIETDGPDSIRRLMIAQDTGSAIKGPQRADIFCGSGDQAGITAGALRDPGRMVVLMPLPVKD
ncbi:murein transglycosylase A [Tropicimonas aquimaris]|uniref:peptidoglycan lytic exotransglycosylase n=1 Tax=Tropicimonas aquimaris TaxID=914152 RepID=A0ABW3IXT2_9RHOB